MVYHILIGLFLNICLELVVMKVTGIIAEFNPFHNGHKYILNEARKNTQADYIVVVMSGNHTQRGMVSCMDKHKRAESALKNGADLVLEIPVSYATSTAESFAYGGVSILEQLGVIGTLAFGAECGSIDELEKCHKMLKEPTQECNITINDAISEGLSYPAARMKAYPEYEHILKEPNNILALEYLKALDEIGSTILAHAIKRVGAGYHDEDINDLASAQGIRNALCKLDADINNAVYIKSKIRDAVPQTTFEYLCQMIDSGSIMDSSEYDLLVKYSLLTKDVIDLAAYQDVNKDIAHRIIKFRDQCNSFEELAMAVKSKNITYTRICRALTHILLEIKNDNRDCEGKLMKVPYTQILGFRKDATSLLHEVTKKTSIPIVTKPNDYRKILDTEGINAFEDNLRADRIYYSAMSHKTNSRLADPLKLSPLVID